MFKERMTETMMYRVLKGISDIHQGTFCSIETGGSSIGVPDVYYFDPAITGWIELKVIKWIARDEVYRFDYRKGQLPWLRKHHRTNKRTFCLGWYDNQYFLFDEFYKEMDDIEKRSLWYGPSLKDKGLLNILFGEKKK